MTDFNDKVEQKPESLKVLKSLSFKDFNDYLYPRDGEIPVESERGRLTVLLLFLVARLLPSLPVCRLEDCLVFPLLGSPQRQSGPVSHH